MAFLVSGRDEEEVKLRAFPLVLREEAKVWFQGLEQRKKGDWGTLCEAFVGRFGGGCSPEEIWRKLSSLQQTSPLSYVEYETQFFKLWAEWENTLEQGERAPNFLQKERFLDGLSSPLKEKVKGKFPRTFEEAIQLAQLKDQKLQFQAYLSRTNQPQPQVQNVAHEVPTQVPTTLEDPHLELLQRVTNQLDNLSINMVQGAQRQQHQPHNGERGLNDQRQQRQRQQRRDYFCYNCGEDGHELQVHQGAEGQDFKKALKEEYFLEDSQRVTKQSFIKWIKQWNKGLSVPTDARLQKSLEQLLEDASGELGLTSDWKLVFDAVNVIVKQQMKVDTLIVADSSKTSDEEVKEKSATLKHKLEEPILDDLVKGQDFHAGVVCGVTFKIMSVKTVIISMNLTGRTLCSGKITRSILEQQVISKAKEEDDKAYGELWPYALKTAERGKVSRGKLCEAGNYIREIKGWSDQVDLLSVYAYIAKSEANEAWVEEKRKRDEQMAGSSKRATRSSNKKEEVLKP
ncbi:hypothetical protein L7F22_020555 [Adiantum nelumboides]|nr:hypothetical protein [Adiantum nelumboides]